MEGQGERPCGLCKEKRSRERSRNGIQESPGFNKNIKKLGLLIIGVRGRDSRYSNYRSYSSSLVFINIRDTPLYLKMS